MLEVYTLEQADKWDAAVKSFKNYDTYYLSGYVKAFKIHGDGEPLLFYYTDSKTRGINVVMKRDISKSEGFTGKIEKNTYFDFATPYGYGGWLIEGENTKKLFGKYNGWCQKNGIISEFVRFHPVLKNDISVKEFYDVTPLGEVVTMDLTSEEVIFKNVTSKNRNVIRKAIKNGVKIYNGRFPEIYCRFKEVYDRTMDKDDADEYYYFADEFYESILEDLPENAQVFYAVKDDVVIAASIMLQANGRMNYHLSGSVKEYSCLAPTNLLLYKAALWGSANGYKTLYLGGGVGSGDDSLFKFKKAFYRKDDLLRFHIGSKIFDEERYNELVELRGNKDVDEEFFPRYRA